MTIPELLLILNAAIYGSIAIRMLLFRRDGSRHRWWGGWLAYILIVVAASVPIRTCYGITSAPTGQKSSSTLCSWLL